MKVAVCFSGTSRTPDNGLESLKLILPNDNIKVFGHTWINLANEKNYVNSNLDVNRGSNFELLEKFNFETLLVENYKTKKIHFQKMYDFFSFKLHDSPPRTDLGIISMFYSIYQSNYLKRKYELSNKMKFDKVIRIRFDSDFENKNLDLKTILGDLSIPSGNDWCGGLNDQFAIGSSESMDIYCDLYNSFSMIKHVPYHAESMLGEYLKIRNVQISRFDFKILISSSRLSWDQR
jgi:hypothetical protein